MHATATGELGRDDAVSLRCMEALNDSFEVVMAPGRSSDGRFHARARP